MNAGIPASVERIRRRCAGVTLVELMAVIAIMGILSGIGVAGLRTAVANARIKDAAYNVSAFMERVANESRRVSASLCVKKVNDQKLVAYKSACTESTMGPKIDSLVLETPNKFINASIAGAAFNGLSNWYSSGANFTPRSGLSAAPYEGYFVVQYGAQELYGSALKVKTKNSFSPMMSFDKATWTGI